MYKYFKCRYFIDNHYIKVIYLDIVLHKFYITYLISYNFVYNTSKLH